MNKTDTIILYLEKLLNVLFPTQCVVCGKEGPDLCDECMANFAWPKPRKRKDRWKVSLWNYRDQKVEKVMRHLKNHPNRRLAGIIARTFQGMIMNRPKDPESWIVVPIPIGRKRFRQRGYNQAELIARPLAQAFGFSLATSVLVKIRHTRKQGTSRSKEERRANVVGAFGIKNDFVVRDKNVILVDDITTTGSTLAEAQNTLRAAGARRVLAWTVAN